MARVISCSATTEQVIARTKTQTRRRGWWTDVELTSNPYSKRLRLKYRSRVSSDWSTRQHHNTWRQALARAESGGAA